MAGEELKKQQINIIDEVPRTFIEIKDIQQRTRKETNWYSLCRLSKFNRKLWRKSRFNKTETVSKISRGFKLLAKN